MRGCGQSRRDGTVAAVARSSLWDFFFPSAREELGGLPVWCLPSACFAMPCFHPSSAWCFCLVVLLGFSLASSANTEDAAVVQTSCGPVKGKRLPADSGSVTAYLGIPYAEPPVGRLRFQRPRPPRPWSHVLEATDFGNACPQFLFVDFPEADLWVANRPLSEDCLFLNIWVPHPQPSSPVPVLVWIHGGSGFLTGAASLPMYNGAGLASQEKVIVVSMNYRLGALGFLSLPPAAPGNMGLLDQQLALKWVKDNAAAFGGDPTKVTIFGHNAGAASVSLHLLSPSSQPLFAQAILQSGTANLRWAWANPEEARRKALEISQLLGCTEGNDDEVVTCLMGKNATEFAQHELSLTLKKLLEIPLLPTTDGELLTDEPQKLLEAGEIQVKPMIVGTTSDEGSLFAPYLFPKANNSEITREQLLEAVKMMEQNVASEDIEAVAQKYSEESHGPGRYRWALSQAFSDYFFVCPIAEFAAQATKAGSPVYFYSFRHHTSGSVWPEWSGAPHGTEIPYVFGTLAAVVAANRTYTEAEAALSRRVMHHWAEFARSGHPAHPGAKEAAWRLYDAAEANFFPLDTEGSEASGLPPLRHCDFLERHLAEPGKAEHAEKEPPAE